jgi:hypothetical protein
MYLSRMGVAQWNGLRSRNHDPSSKQAEVEVKVERRPNFLHLSLNLSLSLQ